MGFWAKKVDESKEPLVHVEVCHFRPRALHACNYSGRAELADRNDESATVWLCVPLRDGGACADDMPWCFSWRTPARGALHILRVDDGSNAGTHGGMPDRAPSNTARFQFNPNSRPRSDGGQSSVHGIRQAQERHNNPYSARIGLQKCNRFENRELDI